jgi:uncharacterized membrane protein YraQ (UPF0718 family)
VNIGVLILNLLLVALLVMALRRGRVALEPAAKRWMEQFAVLVPRLLLALIGAGFLAKLIPSDVIASFLGDDAGFLGILIGAFAGLLIPAGPVVAFSIAAVFARAGATSPALIAFVSAWSLFALHRIFIYEIPLLGASFMRLRLASIWFMPFAAGALAALVLQIIG